MIPEKLPNRLMNNPLPHAKNCNYKYGESKVKCILMNFCCIQGIMYFHWKSIRPSISNWTKHHFSHFKFDCISDCNLSRIRFQLDSSSCVSGSPVTPNRSQYDLEYSIDYGQSWSSIERPSTRTSNTNDIIITGPLRATRNVFYLPLHAYRPLSK